MADYISEGEKPHNPKPSLGVCTAPAGYATCTCVSHQSMSGVCLVASTLALTFNFHFLRPRERKDANTQRNMLLLVGICFFPIVVVMHSHTTLFAYTTLVAECQGSCLSAVDPVHADHSQTSNIL